MGVIDWPLLRATPQISPHGHEHAPACRIAYGTSGTPLRPLRATLATLPLSSLARALFVSELPCHQHAPAMHEQGLLHVSVSSLP